MSKSNSIKSVGVETRLKNISDGLFSPTLYSIAQKLESVSKHKKNKIEVEWKNKVLNDNSLRLLRSLYTVKLYPRYISKMFNISISNVHNYLNYRNRVYIEPTNTTIKEALLLKSLISLGILLYKKYGDDFEINGNEYIPSFKISDLINKGD